MNQQTIELVQHSWTKVDAIAPQAAVALLKTLEQGLGDEFTSPVRDAWAAVYMIMSNVMIDAAKNVEPVRQLFQMRHAAVSSIIRK